MLILFKDIINLKLPLHNNEIKLDKDTAFYAETMRKEVIPPGATVVITAKALSSSDGKTPDTDAAISVLVEGNFKLHTKWVY